MEKGMITDKMIDAIYVEAKSKFGVTLNKLSDEALTFTTGVHLGLKSIDMDFNKVEKIIVSCQTEPQLQIGKKMIHLLAKKWDDVISKSDHLVTIFNLRTERLKIRIKMVEYSLGIF